MSNIFQTVPKAKVPRATFNLSHSRKLSGKLGQLIPVLVQEVVPGDKFNINTEAMIRLAPMVAPVYHRMNAFIHYFFVPNRIIWEDWEKCITGEANIIVPNQEMREVLEGSLADHMGLPLGIWQTGRPRINTLPFRAYFKIWNEYYRDQNLQKEIDVEDTTWNEDILRYPLKFRAWQKDYFTSALTEPQKGDPVSVLGTINYKDSAKVYRNDLQSITPGTNLQTGAGTGGVHPITASGQPVAVDNIDSVNINVADLRLATRLQRWLERNARAGTRYIEHLRAHWGVNPRDSRLQRPEYLGGGRTPIIISEVPNMTGTEDAVQGQLSGNGTGVGKSNTASKFCEEHGYIIGIMSVVPDAEYVLGVPRMYDKRLNLDFYFPEFAQLGEQEIKNQELVVTEDPDENEGTFGYQSRYAEYKYAFNTVHGKFRTQLDFWHMARKFKTLPVLNSEFITCDKIEDDMSDEWRIFAVPGEEHMYVQLYHNISAVRPMPFLNDPQL